MKINARAFALAAGLIWAAFCFLLALSAKWFSWDPELVDFLAKFYIGYKPGILGGVIGAIWGFIDIGIGAYCFAWLYNRLAEKK